MSERLTIATVGAGRMGRGVAQVFAYAGHRALLLDVKPRPDAEAVALLAAARDEIRQNLEFLVQFGKLEGAQVEAILGRIEGSHGEAAEDALAEADLIFEAVPEVMEAKRGALALIGDKARATALVASTTSTMAVDSLADFIAHPERFLNAHWLNPAYLIPLVEISPAATTAEATTARLTAILESVGKVAVVCAATPGFIVPRLQAVAMNEAARMVAEGVASAEDIDRAVRAGFGVRYAVMGLIEFIDWGGGDILYYASRYLAEALGSDRYAPPEIVERNMADGKLGLSTGQGFYDFEAMDVEAYRRETLAKFVDLLDHLGLFPPPGGREPGGEE